MKRLETIDGETLMSRPLQPLNFVVDTLISQGLHILAGSPKVGKSWLALWLAVTVAKGEPVWGMRVKRGTTLYLCLEDSQLRIQNRLFDVTEEAPANVHFCTESQILGNGLTEQLEQFLCEHPDTSLIIIDTLQMIRGANYDNTYANDYRDLSALLQESSQFIGTPTELANKIDPDGSDGITPKKVGRQILQSVEALSGAGITATVRRSNGKRLIELRRADRADFPGGREIVPVDPANGENARCTAL